MNSNQSRISMLKIMGLLLSGAIFLAACSPAAAAEPTVVFTSTAAPSDTPVPSTDTPAPSETPIPAPTETSTSTPLPALSLVDQGLSAWCVPDGFSLVGLSNEAPTGSTPGRQENGKYTVNIPAAACTFNFQFNQEMPASLQLGFKNEGGGDPWLKVDILPVPGQPDRGYALVRHEYVINPPYWEVTYNLSVTSVDGVEIASQPVRFFRGYPGQCLFGGTPDPVTKYCPITDPGEREPKPGVDYPPTSTPGSE